MTRPADFVRFFEAEGRLPTNRFSRDLVPVLNALSSKDLRSKVSYLIAEFSRVDGLRDDHCDLLVAVVLMCFKRGAEVQLSDITRDVAIFVKKIETDDPKVAARIVGFLGKSLYKSSLLSSVSMHLFSDQINQTVDRKDFSLMTKCNYVYYRAINNLISGKPGACTTDLRNLWGILPRTERGRANRKRLLRHIVILRTRYSKKLPAYSLVKRYGLENEFKDFYKAIHTGNLTLYDQFLENNFFSLIKLELHVIATEIKLLVFKRFIEILHEYKKGNTLSFSFISEIATKVHFKNTKANDVVFLTASMISKFNLSKEMVISPDLSHITFI